MGQVQRSGFESPTLSRGTIQPLVKPIVQSKQSIRVQPSKKQPKKVASTNLQPISQVVDPLACALQPESGRVPKSRNSPSALAQRPLGPVGLERFRRTLSPSAIAPLESFSSTRSSYQPQEAIFLIDPSNYGDRYLKDINGNLALQPPLVVLHETVGSASSTLNFFRTRHLKDNNQASYHTLITRNGTVLYLVPPDKRAYGAGNSRFVGVNGAVEAVKTHPKFPPSVNNFAYHVALESPADGNTNAPTHSGYTTQQYQSLAWIVAKTGVPNTRITTHKAVDRSGERMDPRNFRFSYFFKLMETLPKTVEIPIGCTVPQAARSPKQPISQAKKVSRLSR
jgi:hypothetical protein